MALTPIHREQELFEQAGSGGDRQARELLVERYLPLARRLAHRYRHTGEPHDDLVQVACIGLVKAIDRYDPARGSAFSTYAVPTILGELRRHFRDHTWAIHVPRDLQELALRVDRASQSLSTGGHKPTVPEIAREVGATEEAVLEAREAGSAYRATSLQRRVGRGGDDGDRAALGDLLPAPGGELDRAEDRAVLDRLLRRVCDRDREALRMRFEEDLTQSEIGERLGISQMQVSRILRRALARLRATESA